VPPFSDVLEQPTNPEASIPTAMTVQIFLRIVDSSCTRRSVTQLRG
jgi:hypothetical protein